jgi:hypothetical protein
MTSTTAPRVVLVPVAKTTAAAAPARAVRRYRLARLKLPPLPPAAEHLRRSYD